MKNMLGRLPLAEAAIAPDAGRAFGVIRPPLADPAIGDGEAGPILHLHGAGRVGLDQRGDLEGRTKLPVAELVYDRAILADQRCKIGVADRRSIEIMG